MPSLSKAERVFIEGGAACGVRSDGRALLDIRPVTLETSLLPTATGSARVRIGGVTDIVVGVKAEVARPPGDAPCEGIVSFTVECSSLASPDFAGRGAADLNAELGQLLTRLYASAATRRLREALCLIEGVKCWVLHVDALVLDSGGNVLDALSVAVRAALRTTVLPRIVVVRGEADDDDDIEVDEATLMLLKHADDAPVAVTLSCVGGHGIYLADATSEEERCATAALTVGVNKAGKACGAVCGGSGGVGLVVIEQMFRDAVSIGVDVLENNDKFLEEELTSKLSDNPVQTVGFFA